MTLTHHAKRVLTIAAGTPFLRTLAETLCDGTLTSGYKYDPADPLSLAKVTIYVPTRRSARVLRSGIRRSSRRPIRHSAADPASG